jgi:hypothetical protein
LTWCVRIKVFLSDNAVEFRIPSELILKINTGERGGKRGGGV